jgi:hypothetical protein
VADRDIQEFEKIIIATNVQNGTVDWKRQDYVLEILGNLHEGCIIDGDDKSYQKKKKLQNKRGEY